MVGVDERAFAENRRALQDVAKLSNVSRPLILEKGLSCVTRQSSRRPAERPADLLQKRLAERSDIGRDGRATAESGCRRRRGDRTGPRESRRARRLCADRGWSRRSPGCSPSERRVPPSRWNSRSCRTRRNFACAERLISRDLVEEQHAARRQLHLSGLCLLRARERAALVSKQLRLEQLLGQRGAIQCHERPALAC